MSSRLKREAMKRRWQERREEMLVATVGASEASKARSEHDKAVQQWRSVRQRKYYHQKRTRVVG